LVDGFYDRALAAGRHRDIVGGRWDETGRAQMQALLAAGMAPHHRLLDIGAGSLRLGCKAVPYLNPGHYWATDASRALMLRGHEVELEDKSRLPPDQLIEDADFAFPGLQGIPFDYAIAFGVFTHLPFEDFCRALGSIAQRLTGAPHILFTVFLAPDGVSMGPVRQPDGVVTHPNRPPYHFGDAAVRTFAGQAGFALSQSPQQLPRGQVLYTARLKAASGLPESPA
jgi:hypothetical protein